MHSLFNYFRKFYPISKEAEEAITAISTVVKINKSRDLQAIGHTCKTIYFIEQGVARIYYQKKDVDITESFAFENEVIARVESLFTGKPSRKGIQVLEESEIIAIKAPQLFKLYDSFPEIERLFRKIFESLYVESVNRLESIQFYTANERYQSLLEKEPDLLKRVPLKYIASYLGITQQSLSRIRAIQ